MTLLIIGLVFGSLTGAVVSVLSYFSRAEALQRFIFWSFGGLGHLSWTGILILLFCCLLGLILAIRGIKVMNAMLLGPGYAASLWCFCKTKHLIDCSFHKCFGRGITAFAGPIAFVGLAVPHLVRQLIQTTDHRIMVPASFCGEASLCCCAMLFPRFHSAHLPYRLMQLHRF